MSNYAGSVPDRSMGWHKFLAYFDVWVSALVCFGRAGMIFSGQQYGSIDARDMVYQVYKDLESVDTAIALAYIAVGILGIYSAVRLIKMKENGPRKLIAFLAFMGLMPIIQVLSSSANTGIPTVELMDDTVRTMAIGSAVQLIICKIYYDKRMHLFVN